MTARRRPARSWTRGTDRGSFTAEFAAGLPAVVLLTLVGLSAVSAVSTRLRCVDAAREAVLAASRGSSGEAAAHRVAPAGATVTVTIDGDTVTAVVRAPVRPLGAALPSLTVGATATAALEPGQPSGGATHPAPEPPVRGAAPGGPVAAVARSPAASLAAMGRFPAGQGGERWAAYR